MAEFKRKYANRTPGTPVTGATEPASTESNTPKNRGSKSSESPSGTFATSLVESIPSDTPDLTDVIPKSDGTELEQLAYEVRDTKQIADYRKQAVDLQKWLIDHEPEHMSTEPYGSSEWISNMELFNVTERGHLREVLHFVGCIHETGFCSSKAPVSCTSCEGSTSQ